LDQHDGIDRGKRYARYAIALLCIRVFRWVTNSDDAPQSSFNKEQMMHGPNFRRQAAAEYLGLEPRQLDKLVKHGEIAVIRINRMVLVPKAELDRFISEHLAATREAAEPAGV
jgi:excisionase family DNA binding protein